MVTIQSYIDLMIERTKHLDSLLIDLTSIAFNEKATLDVEEVNFDKEAEAVLSYHNLNAISCSYQSGEIKEELFSRMLSGCA